MRRLSLHGITEIIRLPDRFIMLGMFQRFLHQNHSLGDIDPLLLG